MDLGVQGANFSLESLYFGLDFRSRDLVREVEGHGDENLMRCEVHREQGVQSRGFGVPLGDAQDGSPCFQ